MKHQIMASAQDYWHQHGCIYTAQLKGASEHQGFFLTKWSWLVTLPPFLEPKRRPIGRGPTTHPSYYPSWRLSHPFEKYACQILDRFSGIGVKHQKQNLKPPPSCAFFSIGFHVSFFVGRSLWQYAQWFHSPSRAHLLVPCSKKPSIRKHPFFFQQAKPMNRPQDTGANLPLPNGLKLLIKWGGVIGSPHPPKSWEAPHPPKLKGHGTVLS